MKLVCALGIWVGLISGGVQGAVPPTPSEALQILKDYYAQDKEWWVEMGLFFPLSEGSTIRKKVVESQKQTIEEYLYSHYKNLRALEEHSLVRVRIEEDNSSKVSRYRYTVQPTEKLLQQTPCRKLPGVWQIATYDRIEILRVSRVGVIQTNGLVNIVVVSYTYRLSPSILGGTLDLSEKTSEGACQFVRENDNWKVDNSLQPRQIFK